MQTISGFSDRLGLAGLNGTDKLRQQEMFQKLSDTFQRMADTMAAQREKAPEGGLEAKSLEKLIGGLEQAMNSGKLNEEQKGLVTQILEALKQLLGGDEAGEAEGAAPAEAAPAAAEAAPAEAAPAEAAPAEAAPAESAPAAEGAGEASPSDPLTAALVNVLGAIKALTEPGADAGKAEAALTGAIDKLATAVSQRFGGASNDSAASSRWSGGNFSFQSLAAELPNPAPAA
jgi:hypothetical protein